MVKFEDMWRVLYKHGACSYKEEGTKRYWEGLRPEQQEQVFTTITQKLEEGKFVQYDPIRAIMEALCAFKKPQPVFLRGDEEGPIVQVKYNGFFKLCRRETAEQFHLKIVKIWQE